MWKGEEIFNFFFRIKKQAIYVLFWVKNPRCRSLLGGVLELSQAAGWRPLTLDTGLAFQPSPGSETGLTGQTRGRGHGSSFLTVRFA